MFAFADILCYDDIKKEELCMANGKITAKQKEILEYIKNASSISDGFTEIWTKKEAYLKALGTGIRNVRLRDVKTDNAISLKFNNYYISICFA